MHLSNGVCRLRTRLQLKTLSSLLKFVECKTKSNVRVTNKPWLEGLVKRITVSASGDGLGVSSFSSSSSLASASVFYRKRKSKKKCFIQILSIAKQAKKG